MATKTKKSDKVSKTTAEYTEQPKKKSKTALFWEKYPEGAIIVYDRRAVNK